MYSSPLLLKGGGTSGAQYLSRKKRRKEWKKGKRERKKERKEKEAAINQAFISMDEFNFVLFYLKKFGAFLT